jgi:hypothetical protein
MRQGLTQKTNPTQKEYSYYGTFCQITEYTNH